MNAFVCLKDGTGEVYMCVFDALVVNTFSVFESLLLNDNGMHICISFNSCLKMVIYSTNTFAQGKISQHTMARLQVQVFVVLKGLFLMI